MPQAERDGIENRLLRSLGSDDYALLEPYLTAVELPKGHVLFEPGAPLREAHFITSGLSSIIAALSGSQGVEIGLTGRDGMVGLPLLLDCDRTPHRAFMQVEGRALRIAAEDLQRVIDSSAPLRKLLLRYVHVLAIQTAYTALSNAMDTIEERLARWLLMSHDRQDDDEIALTHEFLSLMMGVRRPSVTIALHSLEGLGFIKATRGLVTIRKRAELEEFAGSAYGTAEAEFARLIGPIR